MQFGKINDIFNGAGINHDMGHNKSNSHGIDTLIKTMGLPEFQEGFSFYQLGSTLMLFTDTVAMRTATVIVCIV